MAHFGWNAPQTFDVAIFLLPLLFLVRCTWMEGELCEEINPFGNHPMALFARAETTVGRARTCTYVVVTLWVSDRHAVYTDVYEKDCN